MKHARCGLWTWILVPIVLSKAVAALATDPPPGTYLESCTGAAVNGDTLSASCKRADGSEQPASLASYKQCAGDIWNNDGSLGCAQGAVPAGPYSESCEYVTVVEDVLTATCTTAAGASVAASLADYKKCLAGTIANIGGRLVCDVDGSPKGAYAKTCVGKNVSNGSLKALCPTKAGAYQSASLASYERCLPNSIANVNGALVCDWAEHPAGNYTKSCFFKKTNGSMLIASCLTKQGELQATSLGDYESCTGGIYNDNGDLRCGPP
jgi:hypothetical protein